MTTWKKRRIGFFGLAIIAAIVMNEHAQSDELVLPKSGCPMAHCDLSMSDQVNMPAPDGPEIGLLWSEYLGYGSNSGLGAASNGKIVACTFNNETEQNNLIVYDAEGNRLWDSDYDLNKYAYASSPIIFTDGQVIACDNKKIIRYSNTGEKIWETDFEQDAIPISPIMIEGNILILATKGGPVSAYDARTGHLLDEKLIEDDGSGIFDTVNTPCAKDNRIYISTCNTSEDRKHEGRLYAIDVITKTGAVELSVAWHFQFGGPSGASPLLIEDDISPIICFDGNWGEGLVGPDARREPTVFAIRDMGTHWEELASEQIAGPVAASFTADPRGGFWYFPAYTNWIVRRTLNGEIAQPVNLNRLMNEPGNFMAHSATTIYGNITSPVLVCSVAEKGETGGDKLKQGKAYVVGIDLTAPWGSLLWKFPIAYPVDPSDNPYYNITSGQFPAIMKDNKTRIVFTNKNTGVFCIGN